MKGRYTISFHGAMKGGLYFWMVRTVLFSLKLLAQLSKCFKIHICAWVLMKTHYHLLLQTKRANHSESIQCMGSNLDY